MALPNDSIFQQLSTVQNKLQPMPVSVASASDMNELITTFLSIVTGTTAIATIDPLVTGTHMIVLVFTNANPGGVTTGGNIANAVDPAQYVPVFLVYNPVAALWYAK